MSAAKKNINPSELPQSTDSWYFLCRKIRAWVNSNSGEPFRPYVLLTFNLQTGMIRATQMLEQLPTSEEIHEMLFGTMAIPMEKRTSIPQRPKRVIFEDQQTFKNLKSALLEIGVDARYKPEKQFFDELIADLESSFEQNEVILAGLLTQPHVTRKMVEALFKAAAQFYRSEPWVILSNNDLLSIKLPTQNAPYYICVMGQGGVEYGLVVFKKWQDVEEFYASNDPDEPVIPNTGHAVLNFEEIYYVPFDDLDNIENFGWEVAGEKAYPVPIVIFPDFSVERPPKDDILFYEAALQAIAVFIQEHVEFQEDGKLADIKLNIPITTFTGAMEVSLEYPAGQLDAIAFQNTIAQSEEIPFDRRLMEADMARMFGGLSAREIDPKLQQAQKLIHEAWEVQNPIERISLAQNALSITEDCVDAYVLLAEEMAADVQEALQYFQKGVHAGERSFGKNYFEENKGHFWGLLETRPYMRAMEGLAGCQWRLGNKVKASSIYRKMLDLNSGDNQGIRYLLVLLLLDMNKDQEIEELLNEYVDEISAVWLYTQALLLFRKSGKSTPANNALETALERNPHIPPYLTGKIRIPLELPPYIGLGDENEAISYAAEHINYWRRTPGAIEWLKAVLDNNSTGG